MEQEFQKKSVSNSNESENETDESGSKELPIFRGPEGGNVKYDIKELKRFRFRVERSLPKQEVTRKMLIPEIIAPVRRPGRSYDEERDRRHERKRSSEGNERERSSHRGSKEPSNTSQTEYRYQHENGMTDVVRPPCKIERHPRVVVPVQHPVAIHLPQGGYTDDEDVTVWTRKVFFNDMTHPNTS